MRPRGGPRSPYVRPSPRGQFTNRAPQPSTGWCAAPQTGIPGGSVVAALGHNLGRPRKGRSGGIGGAQVPRRHPGDATPASGKPRFRARASPSRLGTAHAGQTGRCNRTFHSRLVDLHGIPCRSTRRVPLPRFARARGRETWRDTRQTPSIGAGAGNFGTKRHSGRALEDRGHAARDTCEGRGRAADATRAGGTRREATRAGAREASQVTRP